mmetsp:Transcript_18137/g.21391  ORF Transcript_18137/g.21391 Transcript_18137/m.21391 type:complete len:92 (-) Transcript_18137:77-352(-)
MEEFHFANIPMKRNQTKKTVIKLTTKKVAAQVDRLGWYIYYTRDTHLLTFNKSDDIFRGCVDASFGNVHGYGMVAIALLVLVLKMAYDTEL